METKTSGNLLTAYVEITDGPRIQCGRAADLAIHLGDPCIVGHGGLVDSGRVAVLTSRPFDGSGPQAAKILRRATLQDQSKARENDLMCRMARRSCAATYKRLALNMRLVRVRYTFDRQTLIVLFVADERVDFREMIRSLSNELHVRVEMRQIGVRDEAAMLGGLGTCGRSLCCCTWLRTFESINVKMAKTQRLSLNPLSISGMCGRLKCCLRHENECYRDLNRRMPKEGAMVECPEGVGRVVDKNLLRQLVTVRLEDERILVFKVGEVKTVGIAGAGGAHDEEEESAESVHDTQETFP